MRSYFITFRSVTYAQRGERVLRDFGISGTIQRTPRWMEERGCGYCLRLRQKDVMPAIALLREKEVPLRKVYVQRDDGKLEEIVV